MEINQLRYFSTVARTGSLRAAAQMLRLSPAALSKSIGLLERELGIKLILPSGRGIVISDAGNRLAARIEPILGALADVRKELHGAPATEAPVRIASFEVFTSWLITPLLEGLPGQAPLLVHEMVPGQMETAIEENVVDIGITYIPIPSPKLDHLKVSSLEMGLFGSASVFGKTPFEELPFVVPVTPVSGSPNKIRGLDGWPEDKVERRIVYRAALLETALELCRRGKAVAYLPCPVVWRHNATVREEFALQPLTRPKLPAPATRQDVYLIKRKSDIESPAFKRLAASLRVLLRKAAGQ